MLCHPRLCLHLHLGLAARFSIDVPSFPRFAISCFKHAYYQRYLPHPHTPHRLPSRHPRHSCYGHLPSHSKSTRLLTTDIHHVWIPTCATFSRHTKVTRAHPHSLHLYEPALDTFDLGLGHANLPLKEHRPRTQNT
jgi:hypothetical protein